MRARRTLFLLYKSLLNKKSADKNEILRIIGLRESGGLMCSSFPLLIQKRQLMISLSNHIHLKEHFPIQGEILERFNRKIQIIIRAEILGTLN